MSHFLPFEQDIYFSSASKAKRGYQLGSKPLLIDWLNKWRDFLKEEREGSTVDSREQLSAVMKMEQKLIEETLSFPTDVFAFDFMKPLNVSAHFSIFIIIMMTTKPCLKNWTKIDQLSY